MKPTSDRKAKRRLGAAPWLGVMFEPFNILLMAWVVSSVSVMLTSGWWMQERQLWGENAAIYSKQIQELKQQVLQLKSIASSDSVSASHQSEFGIVSPATRPEAPAHKQEKGSNNE